MDSGLLYAVVAFALVWFTLCGYMAYLARRALASRAALAAHDLPQAGGAAADPPDGAE